MPKVDLDNMDNMYFDVLKELGNIGAGNATTSLSQMLQIKVDMKVPKVELLSFHEVGEAMGGEELVMAGIYLLVEGDITGSMMFLLQKKSAGVLVIETAFTDDSELNGYFILIPDLQSYDKILGALGM